MLTFQEIITRLSNYWMKQGCALHQGYDLEMGAGTFNPATFLRCLGPEPYNAVNVEPSRRPTDGRYGENPNRLQLFHQMQVVMKPNPANFQTLYLESLEAIGINREEHDIRFVHDDWESPTLGAWGLGWEVWLDGMEVTQYTYFQSFAGQELDLVTGELAYGLERLTMYIQGVDNVYDIQYNETLKYGDVYKQNEVEWSEYNFEQGSAQMWQRHFDDFEQEATRLCSQSLPIPAYDFVMKASHAFNMLDALGVISVTSRVEYIARVRSLAVLVGKAFVESRQEKGFPLGFKEYAKEPTVAFDQTPSALPKNTKEDFLFEIFSEELPATFVPKGMAKLQEGVEKLLKELTLCHELIEVYGTPKRLAIYVKGLDALIPEQVVERRGPPVATCYDEGGNLTKQGEGFCRSGGIDPVSLDAIRKGECESLSLTEKGGVEYLLAHVKKEGVATRDLLRKALPGIVINFPFPKKMRWSDLQITYARPIFSFIALLGNEVIEFSIDGIRSGRTTRGHRQLADREIEISHPSEYLEELRKVQVIADCEERTKKIVSELDAIEKEHQISAIRRDDVLNQVLFLTEFPSLALYSFDERFLDLPREVLISEMIEHQKYFPMETSGKKMSNQFVITSDTNVNEIILKNNRAVLTARLSDGHFLYHQDLETSLDVFCEKLKNITFQKELGSVHDKVERVAKIAKKLVGILDRKELLTQVQESIKYAKADLASHLVYEFPELQGIAGGYYARAADFDEEVAIAMEEHWMPTSESAPLPSTEVGAIASIADKLDNLLSYFKIGIRATASKDPYALRRQTFGILRILIDRGWSFDLAEFLADQHVLEGKPLEELTEFMRQRMKSVLLHLGYKKEEVDATSTKTSFVPFDLFRLTDALHSFRASGSEEFERLLEVYKRAKGQLNNQEATNFSPNLLLDEAEINLHQVVLANQNPLKQSIEKKEYVSSLQTLASLKDPLERFFNEVRVLDEDPKKRANRIGLLQMVFKDFATLLDFSQL
ncbi:MAG: hypothetical protein S4CHLAM102_15340 [Chlamydiia bacterium]|nr:hypothetical protein [Chlamydiia bacterium]